MLSRLSIERSPLVLRLLGLPFLGFAGLPLYLSQTPGYSVPLPLLIIPPLLFGLLGFVLVSLRLAVEVDGQGQEVRAGWGLLVPFVWRRVPFGMISEVHLFYNSMRGSRSQRHGYSVNVVPRSGRAVSLVQMAPLIVARTRAEAVSRAIGCRLRAEGIDGVVAPGELDQPLVARVPGHMRSTGPSARVQIARHASEIEVTTQSPGFTSLLVMGLLGTLLLSVGGAVFLFWAVDPASPLRAQWRPHEIEVLRFVPLGFAALCLPLALTGGLVHATSQWTIHASPQGLRLRRRAWGIARRNFTLPAQAIEVIAVASDTEVGLHGRHQAVLCVTDQAVVALGHGLDKGDLHRIRDALEMGLRGG